MAENTQQPEKFTVQCPPKIETIEENANKKKSRTSIWISVLKWIFTLLMFSSTLGCLVMSKVCLISVGAHLGNGTIRKAKSDNTNNTNNIAYSSHDISADVSFTMMILFMLIPHCISFLRAFADPSTGRWPTWKTIAWGVLASFLESFGLCLYSILLIGVFKDALHSILFMNGIFIFPVAYQVFREIRKLVRRRSSTGHLEKYDWITFIRFALSTLLSLSGFILIIVVVVIRGADYRHWMILVSVLCISIAWSPKLLKLQVYSEERMTEDEANNAKEIRLTRSRITFITSILKIIFTISIAFILNAALEITGSEDPGKSVKYGFEHFTDIKEKLIQFILQVVCSLFGYILCWVACTTNLQKICFVIPLLLATPVSIAVVHFEEQWTGTEEWDVWIISLGIVMWLSQILTLNFELFKSQQFLMAREELLFWLPSYDGLLLEQNLLLNRKNEIMDVQFINYREIVKNSRIYICTTMYREADYEMEQLLKSLSKVDEAREKCKRNFESHIWFDDGARGHVIKRYALQLISLMNGAMGIRPSDVTKMETPYGLQLRWELPHGMPFVLHLKDKVKAKNKKRWSQVMYMSYILDFKQKQCDSNDDLTYILATDADVKFSPDDVMTLMDLMSRNPKVAAVCGRTQPMGSGPLVWYQIFDYAIGHWLLKVANHVFGSVLCSPGCFSVYRARAIRDVLPLYASGTVTAMDFLMKDMGEDRWFCTLLVEAGWKLEYCAASKDSTYCPMDFDEFFKQRRRWGPSTLANSLVVLQKQSAIRRNNDSINLLFIAYQFVLIMSSIIGPATVLLIIAGGLNVCYGFNAVGVMVFEVFITVAFTLICLFCSQDTQLKVAKWLTFFSAVIMAIVTVGLITQCVDNMDRFRQLLNNRSIPLPTTPRPTFPPQPTHNTSAPKKSYELFASPSNSSEILPLDFGTILHEITPPSFYLMGMTVIYILTALLHPSEFFNLIHGIWYFLCLPSGSLLLAIYSVVNLTDRSWGTREAKTQSSESGGGNWINYIINFTVYIFRCLIPPHYLVEYKRKWNANKNLDVEATEENPDEESENGDGSIDEFDTIDGPEKNAEDQEKSREENDDEFDELPYDKLPKSIRPSMKALTNIRRFATQKQKARETRKWSGEGPSRRKTGRQRGITIIEPKDQQLELNSAMSVDEWLNTTTEQYKGYATNFRQHGYDDVSFIAGFVKEKDLKEIGIENRGHRQGLMIAIDALPVEEFFEEVPDKVEDWLMQHGLDQYWPKFRESTYIEPRDLADVKVMKDGEITNMFNIEKRAHLRKLKEALKVLQYPTKAQRLIREAGKSVMSRPIKNIETDNEDGGKEHLFWKNLREVCLLPEESAFNHSKELQDKLAEMRDGALLVYCAANVLWITIVGAVMGQSSLNVMGASPLSLIFLALYTVVLLFQFVALLWHRLETAVHFIARAPFAPGHLKSNWSWNNDDLPAPPKPEELEEAEERQKRRTVRGMRNRISSHRQEVFVNRHYDELPESKQTEL